MVSDLQMSDQHLIVQHEAQTWIKSSIKDGVWSEYEDRLRDFFSQCTSLQTGIKENTETIVQF